MRVYNENTYSGNMCVEGTLSEVKRYIEKLHVLTGEVYKGSGTFDTYFKHSLIKQKGKSLDLSNISKQRPLHVPFYIVTHNDIAPYGNMSVIIANTYITAVDYWDWIYSDMPQELKKELGVK